MMGIVILAGGYVAVNAYQKDKMLKEAEKKAEVYIKKNYDQIDKVSFNEDYHEFYPEDLSGLSISGYANGKKGLFFSIDINTEDDQVGSVKSFFHAGDFPPEK